MTSPFNRDWIERETARLIMVLHQTEGQIAMLQQMLSYLDNGAAPSAPDALTLEALQNKLPDGHKIDLERGVAPHED
jgi:hypothetical protein